MRYYVYIANGKLVILPFLYNNTSNLPVKFIKYFDNAIEAYQFALTVANKCIDKLIIESVEGEE